MTPDEVIAELREQADKKAVAGMHRVVSILGGRSACRFPNCKNWRGASALIMLALDLWATGVQARILAAMVDDPRAVD